MSSSLGLYVRALGKHWWALLGSAVFTIIGFYALVTGQSNHWLVTITACTAICLLLIASYGAWKEEHDARLLAEERFNDGRPTFVLQVSGSQPLDSVAVDWRFLITNCGERTARYLRPDTLKSNVGAYEIFFSEIAVMRPHETQTVYFEVVDRRTHKEATLWDFANDNLPEHGTTYFWYNISARYRDVDDSTSEAGPFTVCFDTINKVLKTTYFTPHSFG